MKKRLSIIMPCYNGGKELKVMVDSILANDYHDWELIIVDDGSDEETLALLAEYAAADERIKALHRGDRLPKGAQTCRNMGFEEAEGEFVIFFDSDDYIEPFCLRQRVESLESRKDLDFMVFPSSVLIGDKTYPDYKEFIFGYKVYDDDIAHFASRELPFVVWNNIYRTESLRKHRISWDLNLKSLQDADFNLQTILAGMKYDYAQTKPDIGYRIAYNTTSVSRKIMSDEHFTSNIYALGDFYKKLQQRFGRKYNPDLYRGVMFIFTNIFSEGINLEHAKRIAGMIKRFDAARGYMFTCQIYLGNAISTFIPRKRARQLVSLPYLLSRDRRKKQLSDTIKRLIVN